MIVAGLQLDIVWEDPEASCERAGTLAERAAASGARLLVLPEMFATGFTMNAELAASHAERSRSFLAALAARHSAWVIGGYAEPGVVRPRNACSLYSPAGEERLRYHKIHPFTLASEERHYEPGECLPTAAVEGLRVTPVICYDLRFPELFRIAAERTDLFVVIANWPERRAHAWRALLVARAIDSQAFLLGVNRVGAAAGLEHRGDSTLVDPMGCVLATRAEEEGVLLGEVAAEEVRRVRERFGFLADRRRELYRRLAEE